MLRDIKMSSSRSWGLDRAVPVWGLWAPALKEHQPALSPLTSLRISSDQSAPLLKAQRQMGVEGWECLFMKMAKMMHSRERRKGKLSGKAYRDITNSLEANISSKMTYQKKRRKLQKNNALTQAHSTGTCLSLLLPSLAVSEEMFQINLRKWLQNQSCSKDSYSYAK